MSTNQSVRTFTGSRGTQTKLALGWQLAHLESMGHEARIQYLLALPRDIHFEGTTNDTLYLNSPKLTLLKSFLPYLPDTDMLQICSRLILSRLNSLGVSAASVAEAPEAAAPTAQTFSFSDPAVALLQAINSESGSQQRDQQMRMVQVMDEHMRANGLKLIEAPTGTGKTRAYATVIIQRVCEDLLVADNKEPKRFLVAVPTLALMKQFRREFDAGLAVAEKISGQHGLADRVNTAYLRGKSNYISSEMCDALLADEQAEPDVKIALKKWIEDQMALAKVEDAGDRSSLDSAWLIDSLLDIPGFESLAPALVCNAQTPETDAGYRRYRNTMDAAHRSHIVVCTHAMLCIDARLKLFKKRKLAAADGMVVTRERYKAEFMESVNQMSFDQWQMMLLSEYDDFTGILPKFAFGIVDEAHQLDEAMANIASHDLTLVTLKNDPSVNECPGSKRAIFSLFKDMREFARAYPLVEKVQLLESRDETSHIRSIGLGYANKLLEGLLKVPAKKRSYAVKRAIQGLTFAVNARTDGTFFQMSFSPTRLFPKFVIGPRSVNTQMAAIWEDMQSAVAISATFYVPTIDGSLSADYMQGVLNATRRHQAIMIDAPSWLYEPVTLRVVSSTEIPTPPKNYSENIESEACKTWIEDMYAFMRDEVLASATGGVLVLIASYTLQRELIARFQGDKEMAARFDFFASSRKMPLNMVKNQFERSYKEGRQPIWFAVGPGAWTGMDLRLDTDDGRPDNLCTDLVITKLPYEIANSTVMQSRMEKNFHSLLDRVYMQLKQAMGRLVRKHDLPSNRRIFILDPRAIEGRAKSHFQPAFKPYQK